MSPRELGAAPSGAPAPLPPPPPALGAGEVSEPVPAPESGSEGPFRRPPVSLGALNRGETPGTPPNGGNYQNRPGTCVVCGSCVADGACRRCGSPLFGPCGVEHPCAPLSDGELRRIASRARRVRLFGLLLERGRPLTFGQIAWLAERDPSLSPRRLRTDLLALLDLGLATRCGGFGHRPDYSPSLAAKRTLRP